MNHNIKRKKIWKIWDIMTWKQIYTFSLHDAPVTTAKFNPTEYILATGSIDRTVKYWDLEKWGLVSQTKPEATQIQKLCFSSDGKILFSAAHESLKVHFIEHFSIFSD